MSQAQVLNPSSFVCQDCKDKLHEQCPQGRSGTLQLRRESDMTGSRSTTSGRSFSDIARHKLDRSLDTWSNRPSVDFALTAVPVLGHLMLVYHFHSGNVLHWASQGQRLSLYAAGAGMMALIAGFTGTAVAQYGSSTGPIVTALRSIYGNAIRRNWLNITKWLLVCTVFCLVAMAVDADRTPHSSEWIFETALAISITKFVRLVFLFDLILSAIDKETEKVTTTTGSS